MQSCLCLPSAGISVVGHHTYCLFLKLMNPGLQVVQVVERLPRKPSKCEALIGLSLEKGTVCS
jgi:hypothetical protein